MRTRRTPGRIGSVQPSASKLTLSIDPRSDPIAGSISFPDGSSTSFSGYMELAAALERLRARPGPAESQYDPTVAEDVQEQFTEQP